MHIMRRCWKFLDLTRKWFQNKFSCFVRFWEVGLTVKTFPYSHIVQSIEMYFKIAKKHHILSESLYIKLWLKWDRILINWKDDFHLSKFIFETSWVWKGDECCLIIKWWIVKQILQLFSQQLKLSFEYCEWEIDSVNLYHERFVCYLDQFDLYL